MKEITANFGGSDAGSHGICYPISASEAAKKEGAREVIEAIPDGIVGEDDEVSLRLLKNRLKERFLK